MKHEALQRELHARRLRDSDIVLAAVDRVAAAEWRMSARTMAFCAVAFAVYLVALSGTGVLPPTYFAAAGVAGFVIAVLGAWRLKASLSNWKTAMDNLVAAREDEEAKRFAAAFAPAGEPS